MSRRRPGWPLRFTSLAMYQQIYLAVSAAVLFVVIGTLGVVAWLNSDDRHIAAFSTFTAMVADTLPPPSAPLAEQRAVMQRWHERTAIPFGLFAADGMQISGSPGLKLPPDVHRGGGGYFADWHSTRFVWPMADGRTLLVRFSDERALSRLLVALFIGVALSVAAGTLPIVRRITARLERLQRSVEALGEGDLSARVDITGRDEVGRLAVSFNRAATRIERLVQAQKALLANASHELRSPLARIQMASSLLGDENNPARQEVAASVRELDDLVGEILLASRLEMADPNLLPTLTPLDLTALVAEECARLDAVLEADHVMINADARLMRRLVRNLLENARRYAGHAPAEVALTADLAGSYRLRVSDYGPGVPEVERLRVFEPFYRVAGRRERDGGVGLGLALVRTIARHHGARVWCEGRADGAAGASFVMAGAALGGVV